MANRAIITYATGAHEELLDVALPTYRAFAERHGYDLCVTRNNLVDSLRFFPSANEMPPAWRKIPLLLDALERYEEVVWFDCDLVVVDPSEDFPPLTSDPDRGVFTRDCLHALVRHFEDNSEVPNSGVWMLRRTCGDLVAHDLLKWIMALEVFRNHGWWEQAALLTLMGYTVPPEGSHFSDTKCRNVQMTKWYQSCHFMRLCWNSHPNYRAERPRIVHCSYPRMTERLEVMRALVKDPHYDYPRYDKLAEDDEEPCGNE